MCPTTVFKNVHPFKVWALGIHLDCCSSALAYTVETFLWDTSIQGTQNLTPKNCSHNICICYLYGRDASIQWKGTLFLGPETQI